MCVCMHAVCVCVYVSGVSTLHYLILSLHNVVLFLLFSEGSCLTEVIQLIAESNGKKVQEAVCQLKSGPVTPMGYWQHKRDILSVLLEGMISNIWML